MYIKDSFCIVKKHNSNKNLNEFIKEAATFVGYYLVYENDRILLDKECEHFFSKMQVRYEILDESGLASMHLFDKEDDFNLKILANEGLIYIDFNSININFDDYL